MTSILKKTLFWIMIIPCFLLLIIVGIPARIFGAVEYWLDKILHNYEAWSFDKKTLEEQLKAMKKSFLER